MTLSQEDLHIGREFESVVVDGLTRTQIVQYAGAGGDFNPLHTDEIFATTVAGYDSTIAHGMLTMGMTGHFVTDLVGDGRLVSFGGRFLGIVRPGDSLRVRARVDAVGNDGDRIVELSLTTVNQRGDTVFIGHAAARRPS